MPSPSDELFRYIRDLELRVAALEHQETPVPGTVDWNDIVNKPAVGLLYFHDDASDIPSYEMLRELPAGGTEEDDSASVTSGGGGVTLSSYITEDPDGWGQTLIPAGVWEFSAYVYASSVAGGDSSVKFYVKKRNSVGTETDLFNVTCMVTGTSVALSTGTTSQPDIDLLASDRLVIVVKAATTRVAATTVHFVHEGTAHDSHVRMPALIGASGDMLRSIYDTDNDGVVDNADLLDGQEGTYYQAASGYTAADVLSKLLTVDGASSGVDSDLLDGQHAAAFVEVDGGNYMTGALGIGASSPSPYSLTVRSSDETYVRLDTTQTDKGVQLRFHENTNTLKGRLVYAGGNASPNKYFGFVNDAGDYLGFFSDTTVWRSLSAELMRLTSTGALGIGTASPQGQLHTQNGAYGGFLIAQKAGIGTTAQVIIPNGTGDVTKLLYGIAIASNGTNHTLSGMTLTVGGTAALTCGSDTYTYRINADGSFDVRRTAGSNAGQTNILCLWI